MERKEGVYTWRMRLWTANDEGLNNVCRAVLKWHSHYSAAERTAELRNTLVDLMRVLFQHAERGTLSDDSAALANDFDLVALAESGKPFKSPRIDYAAVRRALEE